MRRFIEQAASEGMVGPEYVYLVLSDQVTTNEHRPWGSRPQDWTDQRWLEYKNWFTSVRFVCDLACFVRIFPYLNVTCDRQTDGSLWKCWRIKTLAHTHLIYLFYVLMQITYPELELTDKERIMNETHELSSVAPFNYDPDPEVRHQWHVWQAHHMC